MANYVYLCDANGASVRVSHSMSEDLRTWGELCERADLDLGDTPASEPVYRQVFAPAVHVPKGNADLKNLGFKKLVKRDAGIYENVTAIGNESRYFDANDPSTAPQIPKEFD